MAKTTHVLLPGSKRSKDSSATKIGPVDPNQVIDVTITLDGPKLPGPDEYVGETLTPSEYAKRFGAKKADAQKVTATLKKFGLKTTKVSLATRSIHVSGTLAAMEAAFKPGLAIMRSSRQIDYRGRTGSLMIPTELKEIVTGVFGLDERRMVKERATAKASTAAGANPLTPDDVEQRYNFPPGVGQGQSIAIAEFGGGFFSSDVTAYCQKFDRDIPPITAVSVDAPAFTLQQIMQLPAQERKEQLGESIEVMMDVQIIAGLCPKSKISVLFSTFDQQGWVDLLNEVISANPVVVSISWGLAEDDPGWSAGAIQAIDDRLNALRLLGITACISSGDDGSGDQIDDSAGHIDFPSCSPNVLSVGGTMLKKSGSSLNEVVWNQPPGQRKDGGGATGGGVSQTFPRPSWQNVDITPINSPSIDGRVMPDVSALAGSPLYDLIFMGQDQPNGGTSASAPVWAALIARVNESLPASKQHRFLTPLLYQDSGNGKSVGAVSSRDITSGNNTSKPSPGVGFAAGAGFDAATGWGVPDGVKLLNALK